MADHQADRRRPSVSKSRVEKTAVPQITRAFLSHLFGANSSEARPSARSRSEWRRALKKVNQELLRYLDENVHTDPVHEDFLQGCLSMAEESLDSTNFWPAYATSFIILCLALMGDYPDHRGRRGSGKRGDHYTLRRHRAITYARDPEQTYRALYAAKAVGAISLDVRGAFFAYRNRTGKRATRKGFMRWLRDKQPEIYAKVQ